MSDSVSLSWQVIKHESKDASQRSGPKTCSEHTSAMQRAATQQGGGWRVRWEGCQDYSPTVLVSWDNPFVKVYYSLVPGMCSLQATGHLIGLLDRSKYIN